MKKRFLTVFAVLFLIVLQMSCTSIESAGTQMNPPWETVVDKYNSLESEENFAGIEAYSRELAVYNWSQWQTNHINFMLGSALFRQQKYSEALKVFENLRNVAPFTSRTHLMAGEAALAEKKYDDSVKWILSVYLNKLQKEEKIPASKIVFLAYLYSKRFDIAAKWYHGLDDTKKANLQPELDNWLNESDEHKRDFENALTAASSSADEEKNDQDIKKLAEKAEKEMKEAEEKAKEEAAKNDNPENVENIDESAVVPAVFAFDRSYVPDWKKICVALSSNDKWSKYNEVLKTYINWHLTKFDGSGIKPEFLEYDSEAAVDAIMKKAAEIKCFAVLGPFFAPEFAESFIKKSTEYSIPVISYVPFGADPASLFFNVRHSKDSEAENLVKYAVSEREKTKFAIAYIDDSNGRNLRDIYWKKIEESGGQVTDIIDISPADKAYKDDVEKVVGKQDNYDEAIRSFKWRNKEKFTTAAIMNRAVDSFIKRIPGKCDFDVLVVLTDPKQTASLLPAFLYLNIEFAYYQKYLNRAVAVKNQELRKDGYNWEIQQILVLGPSEMLNSSKNIEELGKLIDGMVIFAPTSDASEKNEKYSKISKAFKDDNNRGLYFAETIAAEVTDTVLSVYAASKKSDIGDFVDTLKSLSLTSLLSGKAVRFDELNSMTGKSAILIGRNKEPFMTPAEIEEELKRKAEEKLKEGKQPEQQEPEPKDGAENDAPED